ncbi:RluA family pseudouridine synthase [Tundrisphaera sp. TA3]|uniref:RluA family pseudouridine synthase n=1 Tax=Tundrisphaera sp. TA3 TaxID=3435775 RepID=UPI003EC0EB6B
MPAPLVVLWEDAHGLATNKPAGLLTQRGSDPAEITLETLVRQHLRPDDPASAFVGTVHRLDRPVSGVVLWAKTPKAARRWSEQFARREARKEYWAIVEGDAAPFGPSGTWDDWIGPPDRQGRAPIRSDEASGFAHALTAYEVAARAGGPAGTTRLTLRPETGRTHQLRAQAASRGRPIVGDATYGSTRAFPEGIALHARSLTTRHPILREEMTWVAPPPDAWSRWAGGA